MAQGDRDLTASRPPGKVLTRLGSLDITNPKILELYKNIESAAIKYRKEDIKAKKYVFSVKLFASDIIMGFEGVQSGKYSLEEVLDSLKQDMQDNQQNFVIPLKDVTGVLEIVVGDVRECMKESGVLASEYEQAGRQFELMRDATAELAKGQAAISTLDGIGKLLALTSGTVGAIVGVFGVLATAASTWGEAQRREMRKTEQLIRDLRDDLNAVSEIIDAQRLLLDKVCELAGPYVTGMQAKMEQQVTDGKPVAFLQDRVLKAAKELERLCSEFLGPGAP